MENVPQDPRAPYTAVMTALRKTVHDFMGAQPAIKSIGVIIEWHSPKDQSIRLPVGFWNVTGTTMTVADALAMSMRASEFQVEFCRTNIRAFRQHMTELREEHNTDGKQADSGVGERSAVQHDAGKGNP